jgi:hypothetical protein
MKTQIKNSTQLIFKKFKSYSASEIIASGGTSAFARLTGHNPKNLYNLGGEPISEEDFEAALRDIKRK